jgi:hypothetical protein
MARASSEAELRACVLHWWRCTKRRRRRREACAALPRSAATAPLQGLVLLCGEVRCAVEAPLLEREALAELAAAEALFIAAAAAH